MSVKVIATHVLSAIALAIATAFMIDASLDMRPVDFSAVREHQLMVMELAAPVRPRRV